MDRDCAIICNQCVQNLPLHQQWEIQIGPLTMDCCQIFNKLHVIILLDYDGNLSSIFPGKREA